MTPTTILPTWMSAMTTGTMQLSMGRVSTGNWRLVKGVSALLTGARPWFGQARLRTPGGLRRGLGQTTDGAWWPLLLSLHPTRGVASPHPTC